MKENMIFICIYPVGWNRLTISQIAFLTLYHRGTKDILLFFQKTQTLQSRGVVTLFHLFIIAIYGRNCFDMQH